MVYHHGHEDEIGCAIDNGNLVARAFKENHTIGGRFRAGLIQHSDRRINTCDISAKMISHRLSVAASAAAEV